MLLGLITDDVRQNIITEYCDNTTRVMLLLTCKAIHNNLIVRIKMSELIKRGYLDIIKYGIEQGYKLPRDSCNIAAGGGHLEVLKWAREMDVLGILVLVLSCYRRSSRGIEMG